MGGGIKWNQACTLVYFGRCTVHCPQSLTCQISASLLPSDLRQSCLNFDFSSEGRIISAFLRGNTKIDENEPKQQRRKREKEHFWEGMWDLPRLGIKPMCPALAGGFFMSEPPGKPPSYTKWFASATYQLWSGRVQKYAEEIQREIISFGP